MIRTGIVFGVLGVVGFATMGCRMMGPQAEARGDFSFNKPAAGKHALVLGNINGNVVITGVDDAAAVEITGVKIVKANTAAEAREHLADIDIGVTEEEGALTIKTDQPDGGMRRNYAVNYQIKVPSSWTVEIENTNGDVRIISMKSGVETSITNGDFQAQNLAGNIEIELTNGTITGDVKLPEHGKCALSTTNGEIRTKVEIPATATARMEAVNGRIDLSIPSSTSAKISAESSVGSVDVSGIHLDRSDRDRDDVTGESLTGTLGAGGATIDLEVTNGEIAVKGY